MEEKEKCVKLARELIESYFERLANFERINIEGLREVMFIKQDDKVLLEHIKAWINILTEAKEVLEENDGK